MMHTISIFRCLVGQTCFQIGSSCFFMRNIIGLHQFRFFKAYHIGGEDDSKKHIPSLKIKWNVDPDLNESFREIVQKFYQESSVDAVLDFMQIEKSARLPDWMAIKLAAMVALNTNWKDAKQILDQHCRFTGFTDRYARNSTVHDSQIDAAIHRILKSDKLKALDAYELGKTFYQYLVNNRFCRVTSNTLMIFINFWIIRNDINVAINELTFFLKQYDIKSVGYALFFVLRAAYFTTNDHVINKCNELVDKYAKTRLQKICILGCVLLSFERELKFAEKLNDEEYVLKFADIDYICDIALHHKEPKILNALLGARELFKLNSKLCGKIYASIVECYGKSNDVAGLERIERLVQREKELENFFIALEKLKHFKKCMMNSKKNKLMDEL